MAKKINKSLLNEELKRFKLLSEYTFYTEEPQKDDNLILGSNLDEADDEPKDAEAPVETPTETPDEAPVDDSNTAANNADDATEEPGQEQDDLDFTSTDTEEPQPDETEPMDDTTGDEIAGAEQEAPAGDEVEVDVTQLVQGNEKATEAANDASMKTSELLNKFQDLEQRVASMSALSNKIETLEKEIVKRNPTPVEKLEMRSMNSFPYNIKLTDYWKDVDGYDTGVADMPKNNEYVLKQDDINNSFTDSSIKKSFNVPDDYEEEDIYTG